MGKIRRKLMLPEVEIPCTPLLLGLHSPWKVCSPNESPSLWIECRPGWRSSTSMPDICRQLRCRRSRLRRRRHVLPCRTNAGRRPLRHDLSPPAVTVPARPRRGPSARNSDRRQLRLSNRPTARPKPRATSIGYVAPKKIVQDWKCVT